MIRCAFILWCGLSTAALAASADPATTRAQRFRHSATFEAWLKDSVILDEHWLELPGTGLELGYFLKPKADSNAQGHAALEDAFFLVDVRTGASQAPVLQRDTAPADGCPGPGDVAGLGPKRPLAVSMERQYPTGQTCLVGVEGPRGRRALRFIPEPGFSVEVNFPEAVKALSRIPEIGKERAAGLTWGQIPGSDWLMAGSSTDCSLWLVDRISGQFDAERSHAITQTVCGCAEEALGSPPTFASGGGTWAELEWVGAGTALPTCSCTITSQGTADCKSYVGRLSFDQLEERREITADLEPKAEAADRLVPMEQALVRLRDVLDASNAANELWRNHNDAEATARWVALYRQFVEAGRAIEEPGFAEPWEEILTRLGRPTDLRHAAADAWIEILNNLGFALWSQRELHQAKGAYAECQRLVSQGSKPRDVLELNLGDLARDLGDLAGAREHYERGLAGTLTDAQRKRATEELRKLGSKTPAKHP